MLKNNKNRNGGQSGFTIIEVLIVLAIAGLILLIVFLAVPALQRSSRNTQRKNDAAAIGGAIANFISNNGGTVPTKVAMGSDSTELKIFKSATGNSETAKLGYYDATNAGTSGNITIESVSSVTTPSNQGEHLIIDYGYKCNSDNTAVGSASSRTAAIIYWTETGGGNFAKQCVEQ